MCVLLVCLWCDFDNCPLFPAPSSPLWSSASASPTSGAPLQNTHPHLHSYLRRSLLSASKARALGSAQHCPVPLGCPLWGPSHRPIWVLGAGPPSGLPSNHSCSFRGLGRRAVLQAAGSGTGLRVRKDAPLPPPSPPLVASPWAGAVAAATDSR